MGEFKFILWLIGIGMGSIIYLESNFVGRKELKHLVKKLDTLEKRIYEIHEKVHSR